MKPPSAKTKQSTKDPSAKSTKGGKAPVEDIEVKDPQIIFQSIWATLEDEVGSEQRIVMKLSPRIAPIKAAVFPLVKKDGMPEKAMAISRSLSKNFNSFYDEKGKGIGHELRTLATKSRKKVALQLKDTLLTCVRQVLGQSHPCCKCSLP